MTPTKILNRCRKAYAANHIPWTPEVAHLLKKLPSERALIIAECWEKRSNEESVNETAVEDRLTINAAKRMIEGAVRKLGCRGVNRKQFVAGQRQYHGTSYRDE